MKNKNILVPTDFTEEAEAGLATAINIASKIGARLTLIHIIDEPGPESFRPDADLQAKANQSSIHDHFMIQLINQRKKEMAALIQRFDLKRFNARSFIEFGNFSDELKKHLEKYSTDLIVMGTSGETALSELFSGNHTAQTIRLADIPVLAVKEYPAFPSWDKMMVLVDLKIYDERVVKLIKDFSELLQMQVYIVHVVREKNLTTANIYKELEKFAEINNFKSYSLHIIDQGNKTEKVKAFANQWDVKVIACFMEDSSRLIRLLFGSDTEKFLKEIDKPLLAVSE